MTTEPATIADYGFLSDCQTAALVSTHGSVDWWCLPRFDSPSVFGRLLDPDAGHWSLEPVAAFTTTRAYLPDSLVLRTVFSTTEGQVALTDALAAEAGSRGHELGLASPHRLIRRVEGLSGTVTMTTEISPRMEFAQTLPHTRDIDGGVELWGGPVRLICTGPLAFRREHSRALAEFTVAAGDVVELHLQYEPTFAGRPPDVGKPSIEDTLAAWQSWAEQHQSYDGPHSDLVRRSAIVLHGLTYQPSGAVVAAATTSLPEKMGGDLNWDYRFAWLRDFALTIRALWVAACPHEPQRLLDWFSSSIGHLDAQPLQIVYGVEGERDLTERELPQFRGFGGSSPARAGNSAWTQRQLDVFGEVFEAALLLVQLIERSGADVDLSESNRDLLNNLAHHAVEHWNDPDAGMWESRDKPRHYTSSKVMCWVALDRAVQLAPVLGDEADPAGWAAARDQIEADVLDRAWSKKLGAFAGAFGSDELDASVMMMPIMGMVAADDPRMLATIEAIEKGLGDKGDLVRRWRSDNAGFLICTYWLVQCLALAGETARAEEWFRRATSRANDVGLLTEEGDLDSGESLGNVPQAFSHVGLINAAWALSGNGVPGHPASR